VVLAKVLVSILPVFVLATLRLGLAAMVLGPLLLVRERGLPRLSARERRLLVLQAFAGIFAFNTLLLWGLRLTSATAGAIVTSTTPAVAAALGVLVLGESWTRVQAAGIGLTVLGLAALGASGVAPDGRGAAPLVGNLLVFGAVVGEAVYVVCGRALAPRLSPLAVATGLTVLGFVMFLPLGLAELPEAPLAELSVGQWAAVAYYSVAVTVVAFWLWARGIARVPASTAGLFTGFMPLTAVTLSVLVLGEPVRWGYLAGGVGVVAGVVLATRER
jgi:drug/metabolite transporter (DMT)-like permease